MNRRLMTILLGAFVVAALCAFMVNRLVSNRVSQSNQPTTIRIVAASEDIKLGTILSSKDLTTVEIAGPLPKGAILSADKALGRGVIANLYQGEPILDSRLAAQGSGGRTGGHDQTRHARLCHQGR